MKLSELFAATGEPFMFYPGFVHRFGISVNASIFLCFIGWKSFADNLDEWQSYNTDEIERRTGLTGKEQASARKQLTAASLVEEKYARLEHVLKFRLSPSDLQIEKSPFDKSANGEATKEQMPIRQKRKSLVRQELVQEENKNSITPELIYSRFPLKVGRPKALAAIRKAVERGAAPETLLAKTIAFAFARNGDLEYCPHPSTWFNQERYNDEPSTWSKGGKAGASDSIKEALTAKIAALYSDHDDCGSGTRRAQLVKEIRAAESELKAMR